MAKSGFEKWYEKTIKKPLGGDYLSSQYKEGWLAALQWAESQRHIFGHKRGGIKLQAIQAEIKKIDKPKGIG